MASGVTSGTRKGRGVPPPPPPALAKRPSTAGYAGPKVKVLTGDVSSVKAELQSTSTVVTSIDGTRRIEHTDGTVEAAPTSVESADKPHNGWKADPAWPLPGLAARCDDLARPGYRSGAAHEYLDDEDVLKGKVALLADMLQSATRTVVYGGAGLSTSSGIADFATRTGQNGVLAGQRASNQVNGNDDGNGKGKGKTCGGPASFYTAKPNFGHYTVASLANAGLIWRFIQQNHDGLPQKAGLPQRLVNEIHGALFDPSNPIVPMSGNLRSDLFNDLLLCEREADLVLTLGSSLAGMNSDRLVRTCSEKARRGSGPGSVIVSLQTTPYDADASVRIYATIDSTMELLAKELGLDVCTKHTPQLLPPSMMPLGPHVDVFDVPYDEEGNRIAEDQPRRQWDLRERAIHAITDGPNKGARAIILGKTEDGHFRVGFRLCPEFQGDYQDIRIMGSWWVWAAVAGDVPCLPIVNRSFESTREA